MSLHHVEALASLANMHYIASQIHARTPVNDETGKSIVDYMDDATKHLNQSLLHSNTGNAQSSLFSLRQTYQHTQGVMSMLLEAGEHQINEAENGRMLGSDLVKNMTDMNAFADHHAAFLDKGKAIVADQQEKGLAQKDLQNNAKDVIEGIADDNNLFLPGSWVNRGDNKAPNGE
jgi:hypothetical protein